MSLTNKNILFMSTAARIGGGSKVLLSIAKELVKSNRCFLIVQEDCQLAQAFESLGGKCFFVKIPGWRKIRYLLKRGSVVKVIAGIILDNSIDLVCCNSYRINPYAYHASKKANVSFLTHLHDPIKPKHFKNFLLSRTDNIIAPSLYVKERLKGIKNARLIYNGIDEHPGPSEKINLRFQLNLRDDSFLIGMVAHFTENKRHAAAIDVVSYLRKVDTNIHIVFVGGNIYGLNINEQTLQEYARQKNCSENVHFLGVKENIIGRMDNFDLFVFPCRNESFGLAVLEAMREQVPVLVDKDSGGTLELVKNLESGEIVDFQDPSFVAQRILFLKKHPEILSRYGKVGREIFLENFTLQDFLNKTLDFYSEVIKSGSK